MAFASITFISNSKLSSIFLVWNICEGRSSNELNTYFIFHIYLYILLILACMFGGCSLWWGKVVIPCWYSESSSFLHSWAWRDDESSLSSGIAIWSFPWSFLYTLNAGMSNTIMIFCAITTKGFTSQSSLLFPATLTVCFVKSHFRV